MPQYVATRDMTVLGKQLKRGDVVPMQDLAPDRRKQLIEQRRVEADTIKVRGKGA